MSAEELVLPLGAQVSVTIQGRVIEHDGRAVIQTPEGWVLQIPASAEVKVVDRGPLYVAGGNWRPSDGSIR